MAKELCSHANELGECKFCDRDEEAKWMEEHLGIPFNIASKLLRHEERIKKLETRIGKL